MSSNRDGISKRFNHTALGHHTLTALLNHSGQFLAEHQETCDATFNRLKLCLSHPACLDA